MWFVGANRQRVRVACAMTWGVEMGGGGRARLRGGVCKRGSVSGHVSACCARGVGWGWLEMLVGGAHVCVSECYYQYQCVCVGGGHFASISIASFTARPFVTLHCALLTQGRRRQLLRGHVAHRELHHLADGP